MSFISYSTAQAMSYLEFNITRVHIQISSYDFDDMFCRPIDFKEIIIDNLDVDKSLEYLNSK
jgi:hypothetical protein